MAARKLLCGIRISEQLKKLCTDNTKILRKHFSAGSPKLKAAEECCSPESYEGPILTPIRPLNCRDIPPPIMSPCCRMAMVVGGANNGCGYVAADQLLNAGAKKVVMADFDLDVGEFAADRLCRKYGKGRARFVHSDIKSPCQIEALFKAYADIGERISIMFNDLDAIQLAPDVGYGCCPSEAPKVSIVQGLTKTGFAMMSKQNRASDDTSSIIFNCASILGIMCWPMKPEPVYCQHEHAVHVSERLSTMFPYSESAVRVVALCPSKRHLENIGLPVIPSRDEIIDYQTCGCLVCTPDISKDPSRLGETLIYLMSRAKTGTTWLLEPPFSLRERPVYLDMSIKAEGKEEKNRENCPATLHERIEPQKKDQSWGECRHKNTCQN